MAEDQTKEIENNEAEQANVGVERTSEAIEKELAEHHASEAKAEPVAQPQQLFERHDFNNMPGVSLIVPDGTPPAELIRIAAMVCEEIGLLMLRKTNGALIAALLK